MQKQITRIRDKKFNKKKQKQESIVSQFSQFLIHSSHPNLYQTYSTSIPSTFALSSVVVVVVSSAFFDLSSIVASASSLLSFSLSSSVVFFVVSSSFLSVFSLSSAFFSSFFGFGVQTIGLHLL